MPDERGEETNQRTEEETNPTAANTATAEGQPSVAERESNAEAEESQPTPEQIQELREKARRYEELEPRWRRDTQELSQYRQRVQQYDAYFQNAQQAQQQQADPVAQIEKEMREAFEAMDYDRAIKAQSRRDQILAQRISEQASQRALQALRVQEGLKEAAKYGYTDPSELAQFYQQGFDPGLIAAAKKLRENPDEFYALMTKEREEKKRRADAAKLTGSQMSGRANGARSNEPKRDPHPNPMTWDLWSDAAQKKHIEQHGAPPWLRAVED